MRIGMIPRAARQIRRENAHLTCINLAGFRGQNFGCNVGPKADARDQQSRVRRLNRYPSPSLRSGPFWVRPTLFTGLMHFIRDRRQGTNLKIKTAKGSLKHSSALSDPENHAAPVHFRRGVFVAPAPASRGQGTGRT